MTEHTPGPWFIEQRSEHRCLIASNVDGEPTKNGGIYIAQAQGPDNAANARLIASAPDLLNALKALRDAVIAAPGMQRREFIDLGIQVNAALAKAEGRS